MWLKKNFLTRLLLIVFAFASVVNVACKNAEQATSKPEAKRAGLPTKESVKQQLMFNTNLPSGNFVVTDGNKIYFNNQDNQFTVADSDGNNAKNLLSEPAAWPVILDDQIFYLMGEDRGKLAKMQLDGSSHVRIGSQNLSNLIIYKNKVFAIDLQSKQLISLNQDGTNKDEVTAFAVSSFILHGHSLYIAANSVQDGLSRYHIPSGQVTLLEETAATNLQVDNNHLYYVDLQKQYSLYELTLDNFDDQDEHIKNSAAGQATDSFNKANLLLEYPFDQQIAIFDRNLYYIDGNNQQQLFVIPLAAKGNLDMTKAKSVVEDAVHDFCFLGDFIYYRRADQSRIFRVSTDATATDSSQRVRIK